MYVQVQMIQKRGKRRMNRPTANDRNVEWATDCDMTKPEMIKNKGTPKFP